MPNTLHFGVFHALYIVSPNQSLLFTPVKRPYIDYHVRSLCKMSDQIWSDKCQIKYGLTNVRSFKNT